jgi:hypothetical protein
MNIGKNKVEWVTTPNKATEANLEEVGYGK